MRQNQQNFGGDWTTEKLERVRKYLSAYATIMKDRNFHFAYIDAFAGTGYRTDRQDADPSELMFPEIAEQEVQRVFRRFCADCASSPTEIPKIHSH